MNFPVDWTPAARSQLATIWLQSADRQAVTQAQATMDRLLSSDPLRNGEHVSEGLYAVNVQPLRAKYEIAEQVVTVVSVGKIP